MYKFRVEVDRSDLVPMMRPHRVYYGNRLHNPKNLHLVELDMEDDSPIFGVMDPNETVKGRSFRIEAESIIITMDPHLYNNAVPLTWGEWNFMESF